MLDHIAKDVSKFEDLSYLDASSYKQFNVAIEKFLKMISMLKTCTMNKAVNAINAVPPLTEKLSSTSL